VLDTNGRVTGWERRTYPDQVTLTSVAGSSGRQER
jgi:hypothetical protein